MTSGPVARLVRPLNRALRRGHPWVYREAVTRIDVAPGTVVTLVDERGRIVGRGWAEAGPIAVRMLTARDEPIDEALLCSRIETALALREAVVPPQTDAYRLVHGENDRLPGVVCDIYGEFLAVQLDGAAAAAHKQEWVRLLVAVLGKAKVRGVIVRSGRRDAKRVEVAWGEPPPEPLTVTERGMKLCANLLHGQKTGLFLDHRESRHTVRGLAQGRRVLDLYAYVGGFSAAAGLGGARAVITVDAAPAAIESAGRTFAANGLEAELQDRVVADVPKFLQAQAAAGHRYDLIVADPPSFAPREDSVHAALRAYRKLHEGCLRLLEPGGFYLAASCSSHVDAEAFETTLIEGADKARRNLQVLERFGAPADHPRLLGFPESDYLKVVVCRAVS